SRSTKGIFGLSIPDRRNPVGQMALLLLVSRDYFLCGGRGLRRPSLDLVLSLYLEGQHEWILRERARYSFELEFRSRLRLARQWILEFQDDFRRIRRIDRQHQFLGAKGRFHRDQLALQLGNGGSLQCPLEILI